METWQQRNRREVRAFYRFDDDDEDREEDAPGVREPRNPRKPHGEAGAALDLPRAAEQEAEAVARA